jgi:uncharacterized protein YciI
MRKNVILLLLAILSLYFLTAAVMAEDQRIDQGEMKTYYLVFLLRGPNRSQDSTEVAKIQEAHLAHLTKMHKDGKMALSGPVLDDQDLRGICVYDVKSLEEAKTLAEADPAVEAGRLKVEVHPWMSMRGAKLP